MCLQCTTYTTYTNIYSLGLYCIVDVSTTGQVHFVVIHIYMYLNWYTSIDMTFTLNNVILEWTICVHKINRKDQKIKYVYRYMLTLHTWHTSPYHCFPMRQHEHKDRRASTYLQQMQDVCVSMLSIYTECLKWEMAQKQTGVHSCCFDHELKDIKNMPHTLHFVYEDLSHFLVISTGIV